MNPPKLTEQQERCLDLDRNLAVVAGAGSGKTRVLVARYRKMLVEAGAGVDDILAITFTRKAAAEMLGRVRQDVRSLRTETPSPNDSERWSNLAEDLSRARICTLHSFCERLLREFPIEAGVDPAFEVIEEADNVLLMDECVAGVLFRVARDESDEAHEVLSRLLTTYSRRELTEIMVRLLSKRYEATEFMSKAADMPFDEFYALMRERIVKAQAPALNRLLADKALNAAMRQLLQCEPKDKSDKGYQKLVEVRESIEAFLAVRTPEEAIASACRLIEGFTTKAGKPWSATTLGSSAKWDADRIDIFRQSFKVCAVALGACSRDVTGPPNDDDKVAAELLADLGRLFQRALAELDRAKGEGRMLDFDDLVERARRLIRNAPPALKEHLKRRFRFVMIDEFQDTDRVQWQVVEEMLSAGGALPPDALCVLGDPKQSIYSFRGADVRALQDVRRSLSGSGAEPQLSENFRSLPMLVDFQNHLFAPLMTPDDNEFEVEYMPMKCAAQRDGNGLIEILVAPPGEDGKASVAAEAEMIARRISHGIRPGDIAILLRRRRHLGAYETALRNRGIPFIVHEGIGYFQRQEVLDAMNLLSFLANDRDDLALVGALRSPLFDLSDEALYVLCRGGKGTLWERLAGFASDGDLDEEDRDAITLARKLLLRWRLLVDRLSCAELLRAILDDTGFMGSLGGGIEGRQRRANIDKLLSVVRTFENRAQPHSIGLAGLVERLWKLRDPQKREGLAQLELDESDAVKIMTIHAAKGLEFPVVFLPELAEKFSSERGGLIEIDRELGVGVSLPGKGRSVVGGLAAAIRNRRRRASLAEEKRLLYVAVTRARDALYLVGRGVENIKESPWAWIVERLGLTAESLRADAVSFSDGDRSWSIPLISRLPVALRAHETGSPLGDAWVPEAQATSAGKLEKLLADVAFVQEDRLYPYYPATALNLYERCHAAFYLRHLIGIPEDAVVAPDENSLSRRHHAMMIGTLTHRAIEDMIERRRFDDGRMPEKIREFAWAEYSLAADDETTNEVLRHASAFAQSEAFESVCAAERVHTELPFVMKLRSCVIRGQIDLIWRIGGRWRLLDYKTSNVGNHKELIKREYRPQLELYALAAARLLPGCRDGLRAGLYLTRLGEEIAEEFDAAALALSRAKVEKKMDAIISLTSDEVPVKCKGCATCAYCRSGLCRPGTKLRLDARRRSTLSPLA